jgi:hypothetical protein
MSRKECWRLSNEEMPSRTDDRVHRLFCHGCSRFKVGYDDRVFIPAPPKFPNGRLYCPKCAARLLRERRADDTVH